MSETPTRTDPDIPPRWLLVALAAFGVVAPGVAHYWLVGYGLPILADVVWVGGYGLAVLAVWYGWLRPLDLTGPSG